MGRILFGLHGDAVPGLCVGGASGRLLLDEGNVLVYCAITMC